MNKKNGLPPKNIKLFIGGALCLLTAGISIGYQFIPKDNTEANQQVKHTDTSKDFDIKEREYQIKITGFDPKNYQLPQPNLANLVEKAECKFGFGGVMPKLHSGIFSETLYALDAEKISTEVADEFAYAPYVQSLYVVGDILFKKPLDLFDRKVITTEQLARNYSDSRIIIGNTAFKNSYQTMESKFGFPQSYLVQQSGNIASFSSFNNDCNKGVGQKNIEYTKVDLNGLPITALLSATYQTSLYHGLNGLYNHTRKSPDFVSENFLEWVQSNNRAYLSIVNNTENVLFPEGAALYIIKNYENTAETISVDFKSEPLKINLNQWKTDLSNSTNTPVSQIVFVEEKFKDFTITKAAKVGDLTPLSEYALAKKNGKYYIAHWELPSKSEVQGDEPNRSQTVLLNLKALTPALTLFKSHYQGEQLDLGTDKENLDRKTNELSKSLNSKNLK